jgi:hypothetical protein
MSDATHDQQDMLEKAWRLLNLQADTALKLAQTRTEVWKVAVSAMTAGAALFAAGAAYVHIFH